jgi:hypothetical protein
MTCKGALAAAALAIVLAASATCGPVLAAPAKPLFASNEMIHLTLQGPIASLGQGPANIEKSVPGTLKVQGARPETLTVSLAPRGITRRRKEVCSFTPIRIEFPEKPGAASLFKGQKRLKLVTHCRPGADFQQFMLLEYAAYRMYNQLTPASFNVRLAAIDYVDPAGKPMISRLGFFIEDLDDVAERNDLEEFKTTGRAPVSSLNSPAAARFVIFQNFIGNLDWSMNVGPAGSECCHNSRLIGAKGAKTNLITVPYDFDFAGMVDAPYATPPEAIPVASVRVRRYRGYCRHNAETRAAVADLVARRAALMAVLDEVPQLEEGRRRKAAGYLAGFYDQVATPEDLAKLLSICARAPD